MTTNKDQALAVQIQLWMREKMKGGRMEGRKWPYGPDRIEEMIVQNWPLKMSTKMKRSMERVEIWQVKVVAMMVASKWKDGSEDRMDQAIPDGPDKNLLFAPKI